MLPVIKGELTDPSPCVTDEMRDLYGHTDTEGHYERAIKPFQVRALCG